ncbi:MAG: hypothetical protein E4H13_11610 [Calditrichales bacterium]|nr:MAG: hypothetical protein E4H13_11610 [Calditrichales bacterium]
MKRFLFLIIVISLSTVSAQEIEETRYGGSFLELGIGPRALAMGSAYVAQADDGSGFYWNPAGTAFLSRPQISVMYASLFNSLENHSFASVALPIFGNTVISASWIRLAVENIPHYEDANLYDFERDQRYNNPQSIGLTSPAMGSFNFTDNAYFLTFSKLSRWSIDLGWHYFELPIDVGYGVNFKMINTTVFEKTGSGIGLDGGIKLNVGLSDLFADEGFGYLSIGVGVYDMFNTNITWDTDSKQKDQIERKWKYGFALMQPINFMDSQFFILYDIDTKYTGSWHLGSEILYKSLFALRMGSNDGQFTAGAGVSYWKLKLDYAYQHHDLGNTHRVGLAFIL